MSRLIFTALLLTSCAAEVPPRADAGDPRVMPVGAGAALDGSYSEGDDLTYAWTVQPNEGATLLDAESPFATLIAEAPGFYTVSLEVCDDAGRCDTAETWARVDAPGSANKVSDWGLGEFASATSGAGAILEGALSKSMCSLCFESASKTSSEWEAFCRTLKKNGASAEHVAMCWEVSHLTTNKRQGICRAYGCEG